MNERRRVGEVGDMATEQRPAVDEHGVARPKVITHNSASVDGRIAVSPGLLLMVDERWPAYAGSLYADVQRRHAPQALLEGAGSFVTDDDVPDEQLPAADLPAQVLLTDHLPEEIRARATRGWLVVPDSRGRVRWLYKEFPGEEWEGWHLLVLVSTRTPLDYLAFLRREAIPYLVVGDDHVDLPLALHTLGERLGVDTVVSTAGGRMNGALLRAGLVDEIELDVEPIAVGGTTTPALFTAPDLGPDDDPVALRLLEVRQGDHGRVHLRYAVDTATSTSTRAVTAR